MAYKKAITPRRLDDEEDFIEGRGNSTVLNSDSEHDVESSNSSGEIKFPLPQSRKLEVQQHLQITMAPLGQNTEKKTRPKRGRPASKTSKNAKHKKKRDKQYAEDRMPNEANHPDPRVLTTGNAMPSRCPRLKSPAEDVELEKTPEHSAPEITVKAVTAMYKENTPWKFNINGGFLFEKDLSTDTDYVFPSDATLEQCKQTFDYIIGRPRARCTSASCTGRMKPLQCACLFQLKKRLEKYNAMFEVDKQNGLVKNMQMVLHSFFRRLTCVAWHISNIHHKRYKINQVVQLMFNSCIVTNPSYTLSQSALVCTFPQLTTNFAMGPLRSIKLCTGALAEIAGIRCLKLHGISEKDHDPNRLRCLDIHRFFQHVFFDPRSDKLQPNPCLISQEAAEREQDGVEHDGEQEENQRVTSPVPFKITARGTFEGHWDSLSVIERKYIFSLGTAEAFAYVPLKMHMRQACAKVAQCQMMFPILLGLKSALNMNMTEIPLYEMMDETFQCFFGCDLLTDSGRNDAILRLNGLFEGGRKDCPEQTESTFAQPFLLACGAMYHDAVRSILPEEKKERETIYGSQMIAPFNRFDFNMTRSYKDREKKNKPSEICKSEELENNRFDLFEKEFRDFAGPSQKSSIKWNAFASDTINRIGLWPTIDEISRRTTNVMEEDDDNLWDSFLATDQVQRFSNLMVATRGRYALSRASHDNTAESARTLEVVNHTSDAAAFCLPLSIPAYFRGESIGFRLGLDAKTLVSEGFRRQACNDNVFRLHLPEKNCTCEPFCTCSLSQVLERINGDDKALVASTSQELTKAIVENSAKVLGTNVDDLRNENHICISTELRVQIMDFTKATFECKRLEFSLDKLLELSSKGVRCVVGCIPLTSNGTQLLCYLDCCNYADATEGIMAGILCPSRDGSLVHVPYGSMFLYSAETLVSTGIPCSHAMSPSLSFVAMFIPKEASSPVERTFMEDIIASRCSLECYWNRDGEIWKQLQQAQKDQWMSITEAVEEKQSSTTLRAILPFKGPPPSVIPLMHKLVPDDSERGYLPQNPSNQSSSVPHEQASEFIHRYKENLWTGQLENASMDPRIPLRQNQEGLERHQKDWVMNRKIELYKILKKPTRVYRTAKTTLTGDRAKKAEKARANNINLEHEIGQCYRAAEEDSDGGSWSDYQPWVDLQQLDMSSDEDDDGDLDADAEK